MSGIRTGTGIFSGIDSASLIEQLLAIEARPRQLAQQRIVQIQQQQAAMLDINSRTGALRTAAANFRTQFLFDAKAATSSNPNLLNATASNSAPAGSYTFRVDRLVTSQQLLSRGFADRATSGAGLTTMTVESARARLDRDVALADLNNGEGVRRGKIVVTDTAGRSATVDLSRAVSVNEVLEAINGNGTAQVRASVDDGRLVISDLAAGTGSLTVADASGYTTAASLGIAGTATGAGAAINGSRVYGLSASTLISSLNDGNGVNIRSVISTTASSMTVRVNGADVSVNLGDVYTQSPSGSLDRTASAVSTVGEAITRINDALTAAGYTTVRAAIDVSNGRLTLGDSEGTRSIEVVETGPNSTTARDLGLVTVAPSTSIQGRRVLAGLNTSLATSINGGTGITGDGQIEITLRNGSTFSVQLGDPAVLAQGLNSDIGQIARAIENASRATPTGPARVSVSLNRSGTGLEVRDLTGATTSNLIIAGTAGADTAASLGIATDPAGVASASFSGANLQKQYISRTTALETLNNNRGLGTGRIRITDSAGANATFDIGTDARTLGDIIDEINSDATLLVKARINSQGDGIEFYDTGTGSLRIRVEDVSGAVAKNLGVAGTATGTGTGAQNRLDGSLERTITLSAGDTLDTVVRKVNEAGAGVQAAVIRDGTGSAPFRLSLTSTQAGASGRVIVNSTGADLAFTTLSQGQDALAFYGAGDVANAIAVTSSSNSIDDVVPGVRIDLLGAGPDPISVSVTEDTNKLLDGAKAFVRLFNELTDRIETLTKYNVETERGGPLVSDATARELRQALYRTVGSLAQNVSGRFQRLTDVGITVTRQGDLTLDETRFRNALATDRDAVEALFTARTQQDNSTREIEPGVIVRDSDPRATFSSLGVMGQLEELANRYVNQVDGILTTRGRGFDAQIAQQNTRITSINARLETRRVILERQFAAMETTIGRLQQQQGALGQLGG